MKHASLIVLALLHVIIMSACSEVKRNTAPIKASLSDIISSFGYELIDAAPKTYVELEDQDRSFYKPVSYESARIRSLKPLDGYHGPTRGNYYFSIEVYPTQEDARKRAEEYRDLSRLASATKYDNNDLSKMTVRCWGYPSGKRAYLLTTHAAMQFALERKVHSVIDGVKSYEKKLAEQDVAKK